ncbi:MAG: hypothetical protein PHV30_09725 [Candidatus Margulisbacteria bacterium]|nr:hypothetical protein [Candidatus Margulisiibacteriota bacterium]
MRNISRIFLFVLFLGTCLLAQTVDPLLPVINVGWAAMFNKWAMNLGWIIVASIGFGLGTGIAIKIFDLVSVGIDEWEEVKKGNLGVAAIIVSIIVMVGVIVVVSIS